MCIMFCCPYNQFISVTQLRQDHAPPVGHAGFISHKLNIRWQTLNCKPKITFLVLFKSFYNTKRNLLTKSEKCLTLFLTQKINVNRSIHHLSSDNIVIFTQTCPISLLPEPSLAIRPLVLYRYSSHSYWVLLWYRSSFLDLQTENINQICLFVQKQLSISFNTISTQPYDFQL